MSTLSLASRKLISARWVKGEKTSTAATTPMTSGRPKRRMRTTRSWLDPLAAHMRRIVRSRSARSDIHQRSEEHTSELQSLMRISYAVFCLKKKKDTRRNTTQLYHTTQTKPYQKNRMTN